MIVELRRNRYDNDTEENRVDFVWSISEAGDINYTKYEGTIARS